MIQRLEIRIKLSKNENKPINKPNVLLPPRACRNERAQA